MAKSAKRNDVQETNTGTEYLIALLEAIPHITWVNKPNGENEIVNAAWYEYTGFPKEASTGWDWTKLYHPDDLERIVKEFKAYLESGEIFVSNARLLRASDQQYRWHLIKVVPIRNRKGEITMWIGTATDIQALKDAEEENTRLRMSRQRDLMKVILQAQENERVNISEALHNGLGQILYAAKLNISNLSPEKPEQQKIVEKVEKFLDEGISVTRNISYELTPTVLKDLGLKTAVEEMVYRLNNSNLKIRLEIKGFEQRIDYLKETSLYRILQELLNNIIKHAQATVAIVKMVCQKNNITITVQDNGIGTNLKALNNQKGVGLSSVRYRIELLEGKLEIKSTEGKGTTVKISCSI